MKAVKLLWLLSFAGYLALALLVYADIDSPVRIPAGDGQGAYELDKQSLFYYSLAGVVLVNAIVLVIANATLYLPFPFKRKWRYDAESRKEFVKRSKEWVRGFGLLGNVAFANLQMLVYGLNSPTTFPSQGIFYAVIVLALVWLVAYVPLFKSPPQEL